MEQPDYAETLRALQSGDVTDFVRYHAWFLIGFEPNDKPTATELREIAERLKAAWGKHCRGKIPLALRCMVSRDAPTTKKRTKKKSGTANIPKKKKKRKKSKPRTEQKYEKGKWDAIASWDELTGAFFVALNTSARRLSLIAQVNAWHDSGDTPEQIAERLNQSDHKAPSRNGWGEDSVKQLLAYRVVVNGDSLDVHRDGGRTRTACAYLLDQLTRTVRDYLYIEISPHAYKGRKRRLNRCEPIFNPDDYDGEDDDWLYVEDTRHKPDEDMRMDFRQIFDGLSPVAAAVATMKLEKTEWKRSEIMEALGLTLWQYRRAVDEIERQAKRLKLDIYLPEGGDVARRDCGSNPAANKKSA